MTAALLSVEEASALLGDTVYRRPVTRSLPVYVIGGCMRIPRRAIERLLDLAGGGRARSVHRRRNHAAHRQPARTAAIGIALSKRYCGMAVRRLAHHVLDVELARTDAA
ncbi:MAG TPA: hypothetical protein VK386_01025 [Acidimicrobiales bacterium]|nr:hypothetical protein [Acidimicrobiales bacterium]